MWLKREMIVVEPDVVGFFFRQNFSVQLPIFLLESEPLHLLLVLHFALPPVIVVLDHVRLFQL